MILRKRTVLHLLPNSNLNNSVSFFSSQSPTLPQDHQQWLLKFQHLQSLINQGHIKPAQNTFKSILLSNVPYSFPSQIHSFISKPIFLETLFPVCSNPNTLDRVIELFYSMKNDGFILPNCCICRIIQTLVDLRQFQKAVTLFADVVESGIRPYRYAYGKALHSVAMLKDLNKCFELINLMEKDGIPLSVYEYNLVLVGLCKTKNIKDARKLFDEMIQRDLVPNTVSFNTLIDGYCKVGEIEEAFRLKARMKGPYLKANIVTYNCLLNGLCNLGRLEDAKRVLLEMERNGFLHRGFSSLIFDDEFVGGNENGLLDGNGLCVLGIKHLFDDWKAKGLVPKTDKYKILVEGHCDIKDFNGAYFWYREMHDVGFILNDYICYQLISGLREEGMLHEAEIVTSELTSRVQQLEG